MRYSTIPVYYRSYKYAQENNEALMWQESKEIDGLCCGMLSVPADEIQSAGEFDGYMAELIDSFGVERAMYVLSRTIRYMGWDTRFTSIVMRRAEQFPRYQRVNIDEPDPCLCRTNPVVLNRVFAYLMKKEKGQGVPDDDIY